MKISRCLVISRCIIIAAFAAAFICAPHISAQSTDIASYWKALNDAATESAALTVTPPAFENTPAKEITVGLQRLRKYEFTMDRTDALVAVNHLERAVRLSPNDAWAHYALGAALARGSDMRLRPYAQKSSYKPGIYSMAALRAPQELERALELDPKFDLAAIELAQVALDLTDTKLMSRSLELLGDARSRHDPMAVFMCARLEGRLGNTGEAIILGDEAKSLGVDASIIALERVLALARARAPEDVIGKAYFDGVEVLTESGAERYFAGVVQLANKAEVDAWRKADVTDKRAWLHRFWEKRAAIAGQSAARQISTLYQKYNRAYDIRGMSVIGGIPAPVQHTTLLGMILPRIRIGDATCIPGVVARCPIDSNVEVGVLKPGDLAFDGTFARPVIMAWEALQFRTGLDGGSQVVGALQVLAQSVRKLADPSGVVDATVTINVTDTLTDSIAYASTHVTFDLSSIDPNAAVLVGVAVAAPPVRHAIVRVGIENASLSSGAVAKGDIDVDRFDPDSLTMSDVVLSPKEGSKSSFERGDVHVSLAPGRLYRTDETPTLYYELYGLTDGESFTTRIEVEGVDYSMLSGIRTLLGRHPTNTAISFKDVAKNSTIFGTQQVRQLQLKNLKPGYYAARVIVTDSRGRSTTREKLFEVRE